MSVWRWSGKRKPERAALDDETAEVALAQAVAGLPDGLVAHPRRRAGHADESAGVSPEELMLAARSVV